MIMLRPCWFEDVSHGCCRPRPVRQHVACGCRVARARRGCPGRAGGGSGAPGEGGGRASRGGGAFAAGLILGDLVWLAVAILGLAVVAQTFHEVFLVIKYAGAGYLAYLSYRMWPGPIRP